jgi:hypothetical protein
MNAARCRAAFFALVVSPVSGEQRSNVAAARSTTCMAWPARARAPAWPSHRCDLVLGQDEVAPWLHMMLHAVGLSHSGLLPVHLR